MIDPIVELVITVSLSLVFFMAAQHKLADRPRFQAQLLAYELMPTALVRQVARVVPGLEMLVFVALLLPWTRELAAIAAMALLLMYAAAMGVNLLRGRFDIDCGCGGKPQALSWWLVLRNTVLSLGAALLLIPGSGRALSLADVPLLVLLTTLLAMVYLAVGQLVSNQSALTNRSRSHG